MPVITTDLEENKIDEVKLKQMRVKQKEVAAALVTLNGSIPKTSRQCNINTNLIKSWLDNDDVFLSMYEEHIDYHDKIVENNFRRATQKSSEMLLDADKDVGKIVDPEKRVNAKLKFAKTMLDRDKKTEKETVEVGDVNKEDIALGFQLAQLIDKKKEDDEDKIIDIKQ